MKKIRGITLRAPQIILLFVVGNAALLLLLWAAFFRPVQTALRDVRAVVSMQESRLEIYHRRAEALAAGADAAGESEAGRFVAYGGVADALDAVSRLAAERGLREVVLASAAPVGHELDGRDGHRLYDVRVHAAYEGTPSAASDFLHVLGGVRVREFHLEWIPDGVALRLGFSLSALRQE